MKVSLTKSSRILPVYRRSLDRRKHVIVPDSEVRAGAQSLCSSDPIQANIGALVLHPSITLRLAQIGNGFFIQI